METCVDLVVVGVAQNRTDLVDEVEADSTGLTDSDAQRAERCVASATCRTGGVVLCHWYSPRLLNCGRSSASLTEVGEYYNYNIKLK